MPAQREDGVLATHAASVVGDRNEAESAAFDLDREVARSRIDGIFDELLDRRGWTLDHFACRDLAGHLLRQDVDDAFGHAAVPHSSSTASAILAETIEVEPSQAF